ncbi:nucleotidyl transferase AbiEii/AbiGii toxin family protein [Candidatus Parcubacteria bacterium]|nr:nucleotidyl transferase AbiEii/AbiGii toxin family protein [Candidatus Parcubacteria bacterium]
MLAFKEIQKHYSKIENNLPRMVLKEYLQYKILEIIFSSSFGDKLVFMGGTSVRIVYGNDRFSEDLDLDNKNLSIKDFLKLTEIIERELKKDGLEVEFRNTFQDVYHCYLKFPKLLFDNKLSMLHDEKIMIRIDSFKTNQTKKAVSKIISKCDIFSEILTYSDDLLLSQKIHALFNRKRAKGRDIYDIVYLSSLTEPDYYYLKKELGIKNKVDLIIKMRKLFSEKELIKLTEDVEPFLINPKKSVQVKKFNLWLDSQI